MVVNALRRASLFAFASACGANLSTEARVAYPDPIAASDAVLAASAQRDPRRVDQLFDRNPETDCWFNHAIKEILFLNNYHPRPSSPNLPPLCLQYRPTGRNRTRDWLRGRTCRVDGPAELFRLPEPPPTRASHPYYRWLSDVDVIAFVPILCQLDPLRDDLRNFEGDMLPAKELRPATQIRVSLVLVRYKRDAGYRVLHDEADLGAYGNRLLLENYRARGGRRRSGE